MMTQKVRPIPAGYHPITPYLAVHDAEKLVKFLKNTFEARDGECSIINADGKIKHTELRVGESTIMIGTAPADRPVSPGTFYVYVENADEVYKKALKAGATSIMEPKNLFYGDRNAAVQDDFGNQWYIATRVEDLSKEEIQKRADSEGFSDH